MLSHFNPVGLFATLYPGRTISCQAPLSTGFFRPDYWSGLLFPSPGHLPDTGIKPTSLTVSCIGRRLLYHQPHLGSAIGGQGYNLLIIAKIRFVISKKVSQHSTRTRGVQKNMRYWNQMAPEDKMTAIQQLNYSRGQMAVTL